MGIIVIDKNDFEMRRIVADNCSKISKSPNALIQYSERRRFIKYDIAFSFVIDE